MREQEQEGKAFSDLTKMVKKSPHWSILVVLTALVLLVDYAFIMSLFIIIVGVLGSYLLVIFLDVLFVRITKAHFPARRILYLNFMSFALASIFFWIISLIHLFQSLESLLMVSISSATLLRVLIFYTYYSDKLSKFFIPALNYTYAAVFALTIAFRDLATVIPFIISSIIYVIGGIVFVKSSTKEFSKEYGESATKIIQMFLNYNNSQESLEVGNKFFAQLYAHSRRVPVKVIDVIRKDDGRLVTMVFPFVHPGPFGTLGSSDLPLRLQHRLSDLGTDLMVFHTTTTNSNNCSGDQDIDEIASGVMQCLNGMEYVDTISRFKRINVGKYVIGMQKFGKYGFGAIIPEREPFDDVKLKEGLDIMHHVEKTALKEFAVIDAQNFFVEKAPELDNCEGMEKAFSRELKRLETKFPARMGYYRIHEPISELGSMGIQAFVTETGDKFQAVVLTDSNNITREVVELARKLVENEISNLEIYTTDNHYVNANNLDINPLGRSGNPMQAAEMIKRTVLMAKNTITDVKIGMRSHLVKVKMGEENTYQRLIDSVFASLRMAKYTILITIPSSIIASIAIFRFVLPVL